jgi:hypothetical protein
MAFYMVGMWRPALGPLGAAPTQSGRGRAAREARSKNQAATTCYYLTAANFAYHFFFVFVLEWRQTSKVRAVEAQDLGPQNAPPRFGPADVFVGIICGRKGQIRSLVVNGFG